MRFRYVRDAKHRNTVRFSKAGDGLQHHAHIGITVAVDLAHVGRDGVDGDKANVADFDDGIAEYIQILTKIETFFFFRS